MPKKPKTDNRPFTRRVIRVPGPYTMDDVHYKADLPPEPKKRTKLEIQEANFVNTLRMDKIKK